MLADIVEYSALILVTLTHLSKLRTFGSLAQRKFSFPRSQYAGIPERALLAFDKSPISISSLSPVLSAHQIPAAFICTLTERSGESLEAFNSEGDRGGEKKAVVQNER